MIAVRISEVVGELGKRAPYDWAEAWDNVGFLAGDGDLKVGGVVIAVNLGREALDEAVATGANLIICHHPPIFKPLMKLTKASHPYLFEAISRGIGVLALHTNFDLASEELNRDIALKLGAKYIEPLAQRGGEGVPTSNSVGKFITYVPETHMDSVRQAVAKAGGGVIGNYTECSFSSAGMGTFTAGAEAHPVIGKVGVLERAPEQRLEMVFPWRAMEKVIAAARGVHPYEEMAYDVLRLAQPSRSMGYGFIGDFEGRMSFSQVLQNVKAMFNLDSITAVHNQSQTQNIKRIAFSPGSGSSFVRAAIAKGVDAYICGEAGYHHMLDAKRANLSLMLLGHSYSERFFIEHVAQWCESIWANRLGSITKVFEIVEARV